MLGIVQATQALIAKLLAEDNPYGDYDEFDDDSESDGWDTRKRKKSKSAQKSARTPKAPKAPRVKKAPTDENAEFTASGRRKRKDAGQGRA